jgi:hypothetical protein
MKIIILIIIFFIIFLILTNKRNYISINYNFVKELTIDNYNFNKKLYIFNSSISKEDENYIIYSRIDNCKKSFLEKILNYFKKSDRDLYFGISIFDKNFNLISQKIEKTSNSYLIEDLRVFYWKNKKFFIGTKWDKGFFPIIIDEFYNSYNIVQDMKLYKDNKNFIPFILNENLYIIKNHNPLELLYVTKIDQDFHTIDYILSDKRKDIPNLRGSTTYIFLSKNRYIGITHECINRNYVHYFTILNTENDIYIEKVSKPICFLGDCGIEFVMGFIESFDTKNYIITLGKNDDSSFIVSFPKKDLFLYF